MNTERQRWTRKYVDNVVWGSMKGDIPVSEKQFNKAVAYFKFNFSLVRGQNTNLGKREEYLGKEFYADICENIHSPDYLRLDTIEIFSEKERSLKNIAKKAGLPLKLEVFA